MAQVFLNVNGSGYAYSDNYAPTQGEQFTIYCVPDAGAELLDARFFTSYDEPIAVTVSDEMTLTYSSAWGNVYVDIYFSGSTPPTPAGVPWWLVIGLKKNNERSIKHVRN